MRTTVLSLALLSVCSVVAMQPQEDHDNILKMTFTVNKENVRQCIQQEGGDYFEEKGRLTEELPGKKTGAEVLMAFEKANDNVQKTLQDGEHAPLSPAAIMMGMQKDQLLSCVVGHEYAQRLLQARDSVLPSDKK